jgi:hypothetical protein
MRVHDTEWHGGLYTKEPRVTVHLQLVSTHIRDVGENVHPTGQDPVDGKARHRLPIDGTHVPHVGGDE